MLLRSARMLAICLRHFSWLGVRDKRRELRALAHLAARYPAVKATHHIEDSNYTGYARRFAVFALWPLQ